MSTENIIPIILIVLGGLYAFVFMLSTCFEFKNKKKVEIVLLIILIPYLIFICYNFITTPYGTIFQGIILILICMLGIAEQFINVFLKGKKEIKYLKKGLFVILIILLIVFFILHIYEWATSVYI